MRSIRALLLGTLTLRFSTSLTGTLLVYYLAELPLHGGSVVQPIELGLLAATFYLAELLLAPPFGALSDRLGHHRVLEWGPAFGFVAVILTWATTNLVVLGATRLLEGASTAASVPSILGYIAAVTAMNVGLRGRTVARFEAATLIGLGAGVVAAGPLFALIGRTAFLLNAIVYVFSYLVYRFGVSDHEEVITEEGVAPEPVASEPLAHDTPTPGGAVAPPAPATRASANEHPGLARYWRVLTSSHVWLLAPTWIAVNACIGIVTNQTLFQLVRRPEPRFADQFLMGIASPVAVSAALAVGGVAFLAGLLYWGARFGAMRRTTIIVYGVIGGMVLAVAAGLANHSAGVPTAVHLFLAVVSLGGIFVLAGATPAALGLLADLSEAYPADRGVIMGLYSVFLAIGQVVGSLLGGAAAQLAGIDGLVVASSVLLVIAILPISHLRRYEHQVGGSSVHARSHSHSETA